MTLIWEEYLCLEKLKTKIQKIKKKTIHLWNGKQIQNKK